MRRFAILVAAALVTLAALPAVAQSPAQKAIILLGGKPKPAVDLQLAARGAFPSGVTFSRLSTARGVNGTGVLATFGLNQPRFVYDPVTLTALGYLSEAAATNIQLHSQFDSGWSAGGGALVASNATSPDGTVDAATFTEDTSTGNHDLFLTASTVITANTVYTSSVFLKAGTRSTVTLSFEVSGRTSAISCNVDLNAGTVSAGSVVGSGVISGTPTIQALPNGWYRVFLAGTVDAASTTAFLVVYGASPAGTISYTGTSATFLAFGADIKIALDYSSYIPTTTASGSRAADVATLALSSASIPAAPSALTIIGKLRPSSVASLSTSQWAVSLDDGTLSNRFGLFRNSGSTAVSGFDTGGGGITINLSLAPSSAADLKFQLSLSASGIAGQAIGQSLVSNGAATMPPGLTTLHIGLRPDGAGQWSSTVARLQIYNTRLSDGQAAAIAGAL